MGLKTRSCGARAAACAEPQEPQHRRSSGDRDREDADHPVLGFDRGIDEHVERTNLAVLAKTVANPRRLLVDARESAFERTERRLVTLDRKSVV